MLNIRQFAATNTLLVLVLSVTVACGSSSTPQAQAPAATLSASPLPTPTPTVMTSQDAAVRERIQKAREAAPKIEFDDDSPCYMLGSAPPGTSEERLAWAREHSIGCFDDDVSNSNSAPTWGFGGGGCRGGEGPYVAIFSDGSSISVYGMSCRDAKAQAKEQAGPGLRIIDFFPI